MRASKGKKSIEPQGLQKIFSKSLLFVILITFGITSLVTFITNTKQEFRKADSFMEHVIDDVLTDFDKALEKISITQKLFDQNTLSNTHAIAEIIAADPTIINDTEKLVKYANEFNINEIHISDAQGIIIASTSGVQGYDLKSSQQSEAFMPGINDPNFELSQEITPRGIDNKWYKYVGVSRKDAKGIVQTGYLIDVDEILVSLLDTEKYVDVFSVGDKGGMILCNSKNLQILQSTFSSLDGESLSTVGISEEMVKEQSGTFELVIDKKIYICKYKSDDKLLVITTLAKSAVYEERRIVTLALMAGYFLLFGAIFLLLKWLLKRFVLSGLTEISTTLDKITKGSLKEKVNVETNLEFKEISLNINKTIDALNNYIAEAAARIDRELKYAKTIQMAALPKYSEEFGKGSFEIAAIMYPAKEVGGDFYDYFLVDENNLCIVIADVSGKGIPAALYMMSVKDKVRMALQSNGDLGEEFKLLNNRMCKESEQMFLTVFAAKINLKTYQMKFVNAGHNSPLIAQENEEFLYMTQEHDFILAGLEDVEYKEQTCVLEKGSNLFLYTDGVSEAVNLKDELYGDQNLERCLNKTKINKEPQVLIDTVKQDLENFANGAQQSDDITMLAVKLK